MRTMKPLMIVLLTSTLAFTACQKEEKEILENQPTTSIERPWNMLTYKEMIQRLEYYDKTRKPVLEQALGFEDTRVNYYSLETIENYIKYVKQLSEKKGIEFTGINFVSGAYPKEANYGTPNYQHILLMPTTNINGKNIAFDPVLSTKDKVVTVKEMLASYGYNWIYDTKEDYNNRNVTKREIENNLKNRAAKKDIESGSGNFNNVAPPYE